MPKKRTTKAQFAKLLRTQESTTFEVKTASNQMSMDEILRHCGAIYNTNHGKGMLVLGISEGVPHTVGGTNAIPHIGETENDIYEALGISVEIEPYLDEEEQRVLIFHIPPNTDGRLVGHKNRYYIRRGAASVQLTHREIMQLEEASGDYSAKLLNATFLDLDQELVNMYVAECRSNDKHGAVFAGQPEKYLESRGLLRGGMATLAAVVLLGTKRTVMKELPAAEISYLYKTDDEPDNKTSFRVDLQKGCWAHLDALWVKIADRAVEQNSQHKFTRYPVDTFDEDSIREAIINAIAHRDYRLKGGIFIRQFPSYIQVDSPGGFLPNLDPSDLEHKPFPRNELLTKAFQAARRADHAGSGIPMMNHRAKKQGKPLPDYSGSNSTQVRVVLDGNLVRGKLPELINHSPALQHKKLTTAEYKALCAISAMEPIADPVIKEARTSLLKEGIIQSSGTGKATRYTLVDDTHVAYTLFNGDKEEMLELLSILKPAGDKGVRISILDKELPDMSKEQIRRHLKAIEKTGLVRLDKKGRNSAWVITHKGAEVCGNSQLI